MVALGFKELSPLFDRRLHNRIVIFCEGYVGTIRFEEVLIDMKAGTKGFERCFEPLNPIILRCAV